MLSFGRVSVIVPVYNAEKYLKICVDSLLAQTVMPFEIILVDDGSSDTSPAICESYKTAHENIRVIHKPNGGLSDARNSGLDIAKGDYITFVDSDDLLDGRFISRLLGIAEENSADIVQCRALFGSDRKLSGSADGEVTAMTGSEALLRDDVKVRICGNLYKKELFENYRFPPLRLYEDEASYYRLIYNCKCFALTQDELYYYYYNPDSLSKKETDYIDDSFIAIYIERIKFFEEKNEKELAGKSKERLLRSLMVLYVRCKKNKSNKNDKKRYLALIRKLTRELNYERVVSLKRGILYRLFAVFPDACSFAAVRLQLNVRFKK